MTPLIFDIGMHTGRDTEFYLLKGFRVVAVEANPELAAAAQVKFAGPISNGQLTIVNKAIVDHAETQVTFFVNEKKNDWGTVLPEWNRGMKAGFREITVTAVRFEELIQQYGIPYYLKIDIEGADVYCLRALQRIGVAPEHISLELMTPNNLKGTRVDSMEILCYLRAMGYSSYQVSDQSKLESVKCPSPALEGIFVDYHFDGFCSGLFGRELQSAKYSIDEVAKMYLDYFYEANQSFLSKFIARSLSSPFHRKGWFDIHASKSE